MPNTRPAILQFAADNLLVGEDKDLRQGLSAVVLIGGTTLFAACDEATRLERLTLQGKDTYGSHASFSLKDCLPALPAPDTEEADIEGMDSAGGRAGTVDSGSRRLQHTAGPSERDSGQGLPHSSEVCRAEGFGKYGLAASLRMSISITSSTTFCLRRLIS